MPSSSVPSTSVLRGTDRAAFAAALVGRLRRAGMTVGLTGAEDLVRSMAESPPTSKAALYWTARIALVRRHEDIGPFDAVFAAVFDTDDMGVWPEARHS